MDMTCDHHHIHIMRSSLPGAVNESFGVKESLQVGLMCTPDPWTKPGDAACVLQQGALRQAKLVQTRRARQQPLQISVL